MIGPSAFADAAVRRPADTVIQYMKLSAFADAYSIQQQLQQQQPAGQRAVLCAPAGLPAVRPSPVSP